MLGGSLTQLPLWPSVPAPMPTVEFTRDEVESLQNWVGALGESFRELAEDCHDMYKIANVLVRKLEENSEQ
eukprot:1076019-Amphidinium_carterae.1